MELLAIMKVRHTTEMERIASRAWSPNGRRSTTAGHFGVVAPIFGDGVGHERDDVEEETS